MKIKQNDQQESDLPKLASRRTEGTGWGWYPAA